MSSPNGGHSMTPTEIGTLHEQYSNKLVTYFTRSGRMSCEEVEDAVSRAFTWLLEHPTQPQVNWSWLAQRTNWLVLEARKHGYDRLSGFKVMRVFNSIDSLPGESFDLVYEGRVDEAAIAHMYIDAAFEYKPELFKRLLDDVLDGHTSVVDGVKTNSQRRWQRINERREAFEGLEDFILKRYFGERQNDRGEFR